MERSGVQSQAQDETLKSSHAQLSNEPDFRNTTTVRDLPGVFRG